MNITLVLEINQAFKGWNGPAGKEFLDR